MAQSSHLLRRLNPYCAQALSAAASLCQTRAHAYITVEHWLLKLLEQGEGDLTLIARRYEWDLDGLWQGLLDHLDTLPRSVRDKPQLSAKLQRLIKDAWLFASLQGDVETLRSAHLLGALRETPTLLECDAAWPLLSVGDSQIERLLPVLDEQSQERQALQQEAALADAPRAPASGPAVRNDGHTAVLDKFTQDITAKARAGGIDPVFGRDDEIRQVIDILGRRRKNNPILVGEPGVGKTALVEGLALRIVDGNVPDSLKQVCVRTLDLGLLQAGAGVKGEFEQRLKNVIDAVQQSPTPILLFIDEAHTLIGAGNQAGGADAANLLKPALARGELRLIGATTLDEYREIEKDPALERRFQPVYVDEPTVEETISILRGLKEKYEVHHGVRISDSAIIAAATLSHRYITERRLPDKAIDLIDEAAARLRMALESAPEEIDALERKKLQLEIEREALKKEKDPDSQERLKAIEAEIAKLTEEIAKLRAEWEREREILRKLREAQHRLDEVRREIELAERQYDLNRAAELRYGELPKLEAEVEALSEKLRGARFVRLEVTEEDIAEIVSRWTGIPVSKLLEGEREKLLRLEEELHKRVVGQDEAIRAVADAIRRARAGLKDPNRPIGSFLFLGPTGVGKTELAKTLAATLFDTEEAMIRIDMTEYMEKHAVSRLIGAPPGYVGYEEGGQLTEAVRRRPYSVILFDEIEKAHPDVFNILLQILDDGRLTDSHGRTVDFRNTVIILTSNLGSPLILEGLQKGWPYERIRDEVFKVLQQHFRPEFLNRLDEIVVFRPLTKEQIRQIVEIQLSYLRARLAEKRISLELTEAAKDFLAERGYDPVFGARPLRRVIQRELETPLAQKILAGEVKEGDRVQVDVGPAGLVFAVPARVEA